MADALVVREVAAVNRHLHDGVARPRRSGDDLRLETEPVRSRPENGRYLNRVNAQPTLAVRHREAALQPQSGVREHLPHTIGLWATLDRPRTHTEYECIRRAFRRLEQDGNLFRIELTVGIHRDRVGVARSTRGGEARLHRRALAAVLRMREHGRPCGPGSAFPVREQLGRVVRGPVVDDNHRQGERLDAIEHVD